MTPEQKAANVKLLATRVMGWTLHDWRPFRQMRKCSKCGAKMATSQAERFLYCEYPVSGWDPYTSIADAMEMLEKFDLTAITRMGPATLCMISKSPGDKVFSAQGHSWQEAMCAACLEWARAQGEK